jgi:hypothetical protein
MAERKRKAVIPQAQEKGRHSGKMKKLSYLVERKNTEEFNPPPETVWNRFLANHKPLQKVDSTGKVDMNGNIGKITRYFVPSGELRKVKSLLTQFKMPDHIQTDLIWSYLNMALAGSDADATDQEYSTLDGNIEKLHQVLDFLKELADQQIKITYIQIDATGAGKKKHPATGEKRSIRMTGPLDIGFMEDLLALYPKVEAFASINAFHEVEKEHGKSDHHMGHKNARKNAQSYYAGMIFTYLRNTLFEELGGLTSDMPTLKAETERLKKRYPDRQLYLFIGRLMHLSELLPLPEDYLDDSLIDLIKKKIGPR